MSITKKINYKDRNQIQDFENGTRFYFQTILKKLFGMIVFRNLPESVNETFLKQTLLLQGKIIFFENNGELIALNGQYSNTPDLYYIPQNIIIANPVIGSKNLEIDKDCIVVYCSETDVYNFSGIYGGLYYLIMRTAQQLADCDISINCYLKNSRVFKLIAADDEITKASAQIALQKMYDGETVAVADSNLIAKLTGLDMIPSNVSNVAQSLIDMKQYILAHFYHEIGLNTNDNMKRAHLLETEVDTNTNLVRANIQNIIETISKGIAAVNEKFNTDIQIELSDIFRNAEAEKISNDIITDDNIIESAEDTGEPEPEEAAAEPDPEQQPEEEAAAAEPEEPAPEQEPEQEEEAEPDPKQQPEEEAEPDPDREEAQRIADEEAAAEPDPEQQPEEEAAAAEPEEPASEQEPEEEEAEPDPEQQPEEVAAAAEALEEVIEIIIEEKEKEKEEEEENPEEGESND